MGGGLGGEKGGGGRGGEERMRVVIEVESWEGMMGETGYEYFLGCEFSVENWRL